MKIITAWGCSCGLKKDKSKLPNAPEWRKGGGCQETGNKQDRKEEWATNWVQPVKVGTCWKMTITLEGGIRPDQVERIKRTKNNQVTKSRGVYDWSSWGAEKEGGQKKSTLGKMVATDQG